MKMTKRIGAMTLAAITVMSSINMPVLAAEAKHLQNGTYVAQVDFMKASDITSASMCNPLFFDDVTVEVKGDTSDITFYVLDPIPTFASAGHSITEMKFTYQDTDYVADIDNENTVEKEFDTYFMGDIKGTYPCAVATVSLPTEAVETTADGSLYCTGYVNAVMASYQNFYMVIDFTNATFTSNDSTDADDADDADKGAGDDVTVSSDYAIPVSAVKTGTDTASSMADYMYSKADVKALEEGYEITLYMTADEIGYVIYEDNKYESLGTETINGTKYDVYTIKVDELKERINVSAYVNQMAAVMPTYAVQSFDLLFDLKNKSTEQTMKLTAEVGAENAVYYVTIPSEIALGELSRTADTEFDYEIEVDVESLSDGSSIKVSAPEEGELISGDNSIAFTNTLGSKTYTESVKDTAKITVSAENVKRAGSYSGTTTFAIDLVEAE